MRMLIATDGDLASSAICNLAQQFASRVSCAELHVLRTLNKSRMEELESGGSADHEALADLIYRDERDALEELASRTFGDGNIHCHIRWAQDLVAATAEVARELKCGLVVVGLVPNAGGQQPIAEVARWLGT